MPTVQQGGGWSVGKIFHDERVPRWNLTIGFTITTLLSVTVDSFQRQCSVNDYTSMPQWCAMLNEMMRSDLSKRALKGTAVAIASFVGLGTVSALWDNPLFIRMTPAGEWEVTLLLALSLLLGIYVAIRRPACSTKGASTGGVLGFLGIACPVCNKVLLLLFGGELLLTYFEPIRVYVAAAGTLIVLAVVLREWMMARKEMEATVQRAVFHNRPPVHSDT